MNEQTRIKILQTQSEYQKLENDKKEKLEDIKAVAEAYKESPIVKELKELGNEYKEIEINQQKLEEKYKKEKDQMELCCIHPLLAVISYKKRKENNRVITASKENATYAQVRCLECGKYTYTKDKDGTDDWYYYINIPYSLVGIVKEKYVKRKVIELPSNINFDKIYDYYQSIMFNQEEEETIQKVLKKVNKNKK